VARDYLRLSAQLVQPSKAAGRDSAGSGARRDPAPRRAAARSEHQLHRNLPAAHHHERILHGGLDSNPSGSWDDGRDELPP
jgi:hypothetical protein